MNNSSEQWVNEHEDILKEWTEKARFNAWMHNKTSAHYAYMNNKLTFPLIICSTLTASANFTLVGNSDKTFLYTTIIPLTIGVMSITSAVLSSLIKFLKTGELSEKHQEMFRKYNNFVRNVSLELSLPRTQRKIPYEICNMYRSDFERLNNDSPGIPESIIKLFNQKFKYDKNKPEIANVFNKIQIHGRNANLQSIEDRFKTIRNFYKWVAFVSIKKNRLNSYLRKSFSDSDYESDTVHKVDIPEIVMNENDSDSPKL